MTAALTSQHPLYKLFTHRWETMRDTYAGEEAVKERGEKYLKPTSGMVVDGMNPGQRGYAAYQAYRSRAVFHDFVKDGVEYYIGMMYQKPPSINLPAKLEPMRKCATLQHEGLEQLLRKINEQQLVTGRFGLMLDLPENPIVTPERPLLPYIATYNGEAITNWDSGTRDEIDVPKLNLVVLNESGYKRVSQFEWKWMQAYRVLVLGDVEKDEAQGTYLQALYSGDSDLTFDPGRLMAPNMMGKTLDEIPFVFVNAQDNLPTPDYPPLQGLANIALAIYRGEADYRQNLFMQGQDTLVVIGGKEDDTFRTGAGSVINLRPGQGVDAKFVGVSSTGLAEQRQALENDKVAARNRSGSLIDTRSKDKESGEALATRVAAQAATLNQIGYAGAQALEQLLKWAAKWAGANPEEVEVKANNEYSEEQFLAADLQALVAAKNQGAPLAWETIHEIMLERGMTQLSYEEEMAKIEAEGPSIVGTDAGGNPVDDLGRSLDPLTMQPTDGPAPKKPVSENNAPPEDGTAAKPKGSKVSKGLAAQKSRIKPKPAAKK